MSELITNGGFAADSDWTKGTNWTISGGQAIAATVTTAQFLSQPVSVIKGGAYLVTFDVANFSSGSVRVSFDSGDNGTTRSANGTYSETITLTAAATLIRFAAAATTYVGRIDNVSLQGLSATVDEQALGLALSVRLGSFASPEARARAIMQAYLNGGVGSTAAITLNETALALSASVLNQGVFPSPAQRVRAAVQAYLGQLPAS